MKSAGIFTIGTMIGIGVGLVPMMVAHIHAHVRSPEASNEALVHTEEHFEFTAHGPMAAVGPLFGADKERVWASGWDPEIVWPKPAADRTGMVFRVSHGEHKATWVNTQFDLKNGNVQYAYVIPGALVTLITIKLESHGNETRVRVEYQRTALNPDANDHVRSMAEGDRKAGAEWEEQINGYLAKGKPSK